MGKSKNKMKILIINHFINANVNRALICLPPLPARSCSVFRFTFDKSKMDEIHFRFRSLRSRDRFFIHWFYFLFRRFEFPLTFPTWNYLHYLCLFRLFHFLSSSLGKKNTFVWVRRILCGRVIEPGKNEKYGRKCRPRIGL